MDALLINLVVVGALWWAGRRQKRNNQQLRKVLMAATDNLEAELLAANTKLETLQADVDRVVAAVDPAKEARIQQVADNLRGLGGALADLSNRINRVAPPPAQ